jgi:hypothetical protein
MRPPVIAIALAFIALVAAGCDEGGVLLVENQTDLPFLVRATGLSYNGSGNVPDEVVTIASPNSKRVAVVLPFAGGFRPNHVEVLRPDCSVLYSNAFYGTDGSYLVIDDDQHVALRREFPKSGTDAERTSDCRTMPTPSTTPS